VLSSLCCVKTNAQNFIPLHYHLVVNDDMTEVVIQNNKLQYIRSEIECDSLTRTYIKGTRHYAVQMDPTTGAYTETYLNFDTVQYAYFIDNYLHKIGSYYWSKLYNPAYNKAGDLSHIDISFAIYDSNLNLIKVNRLSKFQDRVFVSTVCWPHTDTSIVFLTERRHSNNMCDLYVIDHNGKINYVDSCSGIFSPLACQKLDSKSSLLMGTSTDALSFDSTYHIQQIKSITPHPGTYLIGAMPTGLSLNKMPLILSMSNFGSFTGVGIYAYDPTRTSNCKVIYEERFNVWHTGTFFHKGVTSFGTDKLAFADILLPCNLYRKGSNCRNTARVTLIDTAGNLKWTRSLGNNAAYQGQQLIAWQDKLFLFVKKYAPIHDDQYIDMFYIVFDSLGNDITMNYLLNTNKIQPLTATNYIKTWPSPCNNILNVDNPSAEEFTYSITDISGGLQAKGQCSGKIQTEQLPNGIYVLSIIQNNRHKVHKFMVEH
jgi:hypothetical protein